MAKRTKTIQVRLKDKQSKLLCDLAFAVNQMWNYCNNESYDAWYVPVPGVGYIKGVWLSIFDMNTIVKPYRYELAEWSGVLLPAATVQEIAREHGTRRKQFKKSKLKWRLSSGAKKSLGWVPFRVGQVKIVSGKIKFAGEMFDCWDSWGLENYTPRSGSFVQDARGRW